jgi:octaprenyl-diphosphate synthase
MVLAAECVAGESGGEAALSLTPLVEIPHNASLIHDDMEDCSNERRGKPAVHIIYGEDRAINTGAFMYFLPLACLSEWKGKPEIIGQIWTVWASRMRALHLGQAMDIAWHRFFNSLPSLDEYDRMCRLKTGCLARLAAILGVYSGAEAAGTTLKEIAPLADALGEAAEQLGVGFQILDDVKNLSTGIPGKKRGDDIVEGKKSLPVLLYLHRYPEKRGFAARCFAAARTAGTDAPEVNELIFELEKAGVLIEGQEKALEYIGKSREVFSAAELAGISLHNEGRKLLAGLVDLLL